MAGPDPAIHPALEDSFRRWMDTRVKPAYDAYCFVRNPSFETPRKMRGSSG
jgi:hypothetical protein